MRFARHLASNAEDLKKAGAARLAVPKNLPLAMETFESMQYGVNSELWTCAELASVFNYVRGGRKLQIPSEWKHLIPNAFPKLA